ncbi:MAG: metallophosphoesterase [Candidatus Aminicenantaceae bacterium]
MNKSYTIHSFRKCKPVVISAIFIIALISSLYAESIQCVWSGIDKIVAVGDIHGDYENFVTILKSTGLIDEKLHWTGGKTHLVQTGDIMDRGPDAKKVYDLIRKLEKEAAAAGGKVHMLIGNHEELNITGIAFDYVGYVTVEQFISFLPANYRDKKEKDFRKKIEKNLPQGTNSVANLNGLIRYYWQEIIKTSKGARTRYTDNYYEKYGKWILTHNAVIKINDIVFVHGGISEKYSTKILSTINNDLRNELKDLYRKQKFSDPITYPPKIVYDQMGPLWYRELATNNGENMEEEVDKILQNLDAKYMVMGHTVLTGPAFSPEAMSRYDGKIWIIDTGISKAYGGSLSALIIENGNFSVWGLKYEK